VVVDRRFKCDLFWINDDSRVSEGVYGLYELLCFSSCLRVDLILFKVLMCRSLCI
jgi:hypothetical protein